MPSQNLRLRLARERTESPTHTGECLSRQELAELVSATIWQNHQKRVDLAANYIGKLERGVIRWPGRLCREALRSVFGAKSDDQLGFRNPRRTTVPIVNADRERSTDMKLARTARPSGVRDVSSPTDVDAVLAMSHAFQMADRRVGGGLLYGQVMRYLRAEIGPLLLDAGANGTALFSAAASMTEVAGWMAHDGGQDRLARQHFDGAFRLATAGDNAALVANVCASMSHLAGQLGQPDDAERIAAAGLLKAQTAAGTVRLVARLHTMKARAFAKRGEQRACWTALDQADRTLSAVNEPDAEWIAAFDTASLASEAAICLHQLGYLREAEKHAERVIELRFGDRVRSRAFGQLTLARILLGAGRVDEAASAGRAVCAVAPSLTSARVWERLGLLGDAFARYEDSTEVKEFLDELAALPRSNGHADPSSWPV